MPTAPARMLRSHPVDPNPVEMMIPLDEWFGTWHDGTPAGEARLKERYRRRTERMAAKRTKAAAQGS